MPIILTLRCPSCGKVVEITGKDGLPTCGECQKAMIPHGPVKTAPKEEC